MVWSIIFDIPTGIFADKFSRKYSVALGSVITFIATVIYGLVPSFGAFLFAELLTGLGMALISGAGEALLYDSLDENNKQEEAKRVFGRAFSISQIASVGAAIAGGYIASKFGLNAPMLFSAVSFLLAGLVILTVAEPKIHRKIEHKMNMFISFKQGLTFFVQHKMLRLLVLDAVLVQLGAYFLIWMYQPMLKNLGVPIENFGYIRAIFSLAAIVVTANLLFTEKAFRSLSNFYIITAIITTVVLLSVGFFPNLIVLMIAIVLIGGFGQARYSSLNTFMHQYIPTENRATVLSGISTFVRLMFIIFNPIVGFIADRSLQGAFIFVGLLSAVVLIFPLLNKNYRYH
jgi:MFS family permease